MSGCNEDDNNKNARISKKVHEMIEEIDHKYGEEVERQSKIYEKEYPESEIFSLYARLGLVESQRREMVMNYVIEKVYNKEYKR